MDTPAAPQRNARLERQLKARAAVSPRCLDRDEAAVYIGTSTDVIDRLIQSGRLPVVRLPIARSRVTGQGVEGVNRRVLIDVQDLDRLVETSKERRS